MLFNHKRLFWGFRLLQQQYLATPISLVTCFRSTFFFLTNTDIFTVSGQHFFFSPVPISLVRSFRPTFYFLTNGPGDLFCYTHLSLTKPVKNLMKTVPSNKFFCLVQILFSATWNIFSFRRNKNEIRLTSGRKKLFHTNLKQTSLLFFFDGIARCLPLIWHRFLTTI